MKTEPNTMKRRLLLVQKLLLRTLASSICLQHPKGCKEAERFQERLMYTVKKGESDLKRDKDEVTTVPVQPNT